ncbi:MAG: BNR-4 repeat-containing protein [Phycisphaeraceae bacterium]|nr:BNR-4 repeat-containing protein [Phycisphaeraceae bacterium]
MATNSLGLWLVALILLFGSVSFAEERITLNEKDDGYRGIWYMNQPLRTVYKYKYSGGLGTYCAKHKPFAVYCDEVKKTFFCYGGTTKASDKELIHMVSYYDHEKKVVPRPTILLDKNTDDAHDNPVMNVDAKGHIWVFSTSHGTSRPSYIHRSTKPYDINAFELVSATRLQDGNKVPMENFSYFQAWHLPDKGFVCFFTKYGWGAARTLAFMTSPDGVAWSKWQQLASMAQGHYQVSGVAQEKAACAFNYHPKKQGLNYRTNLYYIETPDLGRSWRTVDGTSLELPLTSTKSPALVRDYEKEGLKVYLKDIRFDEQGRPIILYITCKGFESGPKNDPRTWTLAHWDGGQWCIEEITTSDNNYDMGSLYIENSVWQVIGPTETGPQAYNPGGEMALWESKDRGKTWKRLKQLTRNSERNHTYARAPVNAHPDFYAFWADGHGGQPSQSNLYFCNRSGDVYALPRHMNELYAQPTRVVPTSEDDPAAEGVKSLD